MENKSKPMHTNHRQRLYELAEKSGLENLNEYLILELMLTFSIPRKDTNPLAHKLIDKFGTLSQVLSAPKEQLMEVDGVGNSAARFLNFLGKLSDYNQAHKTKDAIYLKTGEDASLFCKTMMKNKPSESFYAILLNEKLKLLSTHKIAVGSLSKVSLNTHDFFRTILSAKTAKYIVITHNHPDSSPEPSKDDIASTNNLNKLIRNFNFILADHIIVGNNGETYSFKENGDLNENFAFA